MHGHVYQVRRALISRASVPVHRIDVECAELLYDHPRIRLCRNKMVCAQNARTPRMCFVADVIFPPSVKYFWRVVDFPFSKYNILMRGHLFLSLTLVFRSPLRCTNSVRAKMGRSVFSWPRRTGYVLCGTFLRIDIFSLIWIVSSHIHTIDDDGGNGCYGREAPPPMSDNVPQWIGEMW